MVEDEDEMGKSDLYRRWEEEEEEGEIAGEDHEKGEEDVDMDDASDEEVRGSPLSMSDFLMQDVEDCDDAAVEEDAKDAERLDRLEKAIGELQREAREVEGRRGRWKKTFVSQEGG